MVMRTFIGAILTTISSSTNIAVLVGFNGEPGWLCLLCCNCDILFCSIVVHWVTSHDNAATESSTDLKISILTAARHSYRDRPTSGGSLGSRRVGTASGTGTGTGEPADGDRGDYDFPAGGVGRGGGGGGGGGGGRRGGGGGIGIHRSVTTRTEYRPLDEMDVTTYPFRRADASAYWSTELLNCDKANETTPLHHDGGHGSEPAAVVPKIPPIVPGLAAPTGVVETVIVSGKDTPTPFENQGSS
ncbi:hypothetical protein PFICI_15012 [Pestalotiopsis fici W106-1]|uniref:Amino acid permease/ SLC12A domain-containing protein n=1 Tax=Pestalotiopsis fici (strain W106-1 / CGMCC3.15140) TaxID=1229662 RepID=W3WJT6_PESFW|nr:uncharacterized protein PFICI_15012 [Pestalotiopsis fici W106-1]ETS73407.1 hypothetical protein PFICI_15012 [Pestalotiopsis fici W106-1]